MTSKFTDEEIRRMKAITGVGNVDGDVHVRGWTKEQVKEAILSRDVTFTELEQVSGLSHNSISQSLVRQWPTVDKVIAAFIGVHESVIWPNRYFVNGVKIDKRYNIEHRSNAELAKLNHQFAQPPKHYEIKLTENGPVTIIRDAVQQNEPAVTSTVDDLQTGDDGRRIVPVGDGTIYEDVSPYPVTLPFGMLIDEK